MRSPCVRAVWALSIAFLFSVLFTCLAARTVRTLAYGLPEPFDTIFSPLAGAVLTPSVPVGVLFLLLAYFLCYRILSRKNVVLLLCVILLLPVWFACVFCTMRVNTIPVYTAADVIVRIVNSGIL